MTLTLVANINRKSLWPAPACKTALLANTVRPSQGKQRGRGVRKAPPSARKHSCPMTAPRLGSLLFKCLVCDLFCDAFCLTKKVKIWHFVPDTDIYSVINRGFLHDQNLLLRVLTTTKPKHKMAIILTHGEHTRIHNLPVFSFISHKTLKRAGFILWQFSACFLKKKDTTFKINNLQTSGKRITGATWKRFIVTLAQWD